MKRLHVIPLKNGYWRTVWMTPERELTWQRAYNLWWQQVGHLLALAAGMWLSA